MYYTPWEERRKAPRLRKSLPLHYELVNQQKYGDGLTQDISEGGLRLISEEFIPRASQMSLKINLTPHNLIEVSGQVRWAGRISHSYRYEVGLAFADVSNDTRRNISEYVARNR